MAHISYSGCCTLTRQFCSSFAAEATNDRDNKDNNKQDKANSSNNEIASRQSDDVVCENLLHERFTYFFIYTSLLNIHTMHL